jgi:hypothetical protein
VTVLPVKVRLSLPAPNRFEYRKLILPLLTLSNIFRRFIQFLMSRVWRTIRIDARNCIANATKCRTFSLCR